MEILLLEDHLPTAQSISWTLQSKYQVIHVSSCRDAEQQLRQHHFDAMIVDLNLPDGSGLDFCQIDSENSSQSDATFTSPKIIVLTGQNEVRMKVRALEAGADDYLTKPFSPLELQARVGAVLRREVRELQSKQRSESFEQLGNYQFSKSNCVLKYHGETIHLTKAEATLFARLLRARDQIVRKETLVGDWDTELRSVTLNSVETHLKTLRKKLHLQKHDRFIETIYGMGYRLNSAYAK